MKPASDHFSQQAELYARYRPSYPGELFEEIYRHIEDNKNAWDCGTGNGQVAEKLSLTFEKVYATDVSKAQLKHAIRKENIEYSCHPAENTPFPSGLFDLVTVAQAIHWFDFEAFYKEVRRTCRQGGVIAVIGYGRLQTESQPTEIISGFFDEMFGAHFSTNRKYVDEHYRNIPFPFKSIGDYQYTAKYAWTLQDLKGYLHTWSSVQKHIELHGEDPADKIIRILANDWEGAKEIEFPVFLKLGEVVPL